MNNRTKWKANCMSNNSRLLRRIVLILFFTVSIFSCQEDKEQVTSLEDLSATKEVVNQLATFEGRGALTDGSEPKDALEAMK